MIVFLLLLWAAIGHRITARQASTAGLPFDPHYLLLSASIQATVDMLALELPYADWLDFVQVEFCWGWHDSLWAWLSNGVRASCSA